MNEQERQYVSRRDRYLNITHPLDLAERLYTITQEISLFVNQLLEGFRA